ncbi:hypothetical protein X570_01220 [Helicobacter pylori Iso8]|nr:hypothetical protein X570_01220 [Helicobacter pylori Iso8]
MVFNHSSNQPFKQSTIQASNHSSKQSFNHSIIQSFKQSSKQSFNHSIIQSFNQATLPYFYNFYKNLFKNPLFFIILSCINPFIPSFINPHHLFKPFDSISPIFKSVGLTELNSKEK